MGQLVNAFSGCGWVGCIALAAVGVTGFALLYVPQLGVVLLTLLVLFAILRIRQGNAEFDAVWEKEAVEEGLGPDWTGLRRPMDPGEYARRRAEYLQSNGEGLGNDSDDD